MTEGDDDDLYILGVWGLSTATVSLFLIYPPFGWKPAVAFFCCVYIPALILGL